MAQDIGDSLKRLMGEDFDFDDLLRTTGVDPDEAKRWAHEAGEWLNTQSGRFHGDLRARFERGEPSVVAAMSELGDVARAGVAALRAGDRTQLHRLVNRTFDLRASIADLDARHVRMVELARAAGASANYAGSGGSIAGTLPSAAAFESLRDALVAEGCSAIRPSV